MEEDKQLAFLPSGTPPPLQFTSWEGTYTAIKLIPESQSNFPKYIAKADNVKCDKLRVCAKERTDAPFQPLRRTAEFFKLMKMIKELNGCEIYFSHEEEVREGCEIYTSPEKEEELDNTLNVFFNRPIGKTLGDLKMHCGGTVPHQLLLKIAIQGITLLSKIHSNGMALRHISVDTFCYTSKEGLFLADASYYKRVFTPRGKHIPKRYRNLQSIVGFQSSNAKANKELVRRDDFEAFLGLLYFLAYDEIVDARKILENGGNKKQPLSFRKLFEIANTTKFEDMPDYKAALFVIEGRSEVFVCLVSFMMYVLFMMIIFFPLMPKLLDHRTWEKRL